MLVICRHLSKQAYLKHPLDFPTPHFSSIVFYPVIRIFESEYIKKFKNLNIRKLAFTILNRSLSIDNHYDVFYLKTKYKVTNHYGFFICNDIQ